MAAKMRVECPGRLLHPRDKAACMLGISVRTLDYLISKKHIRAQKIAKRVLIHKKEPVRFARSNYHDPIIESSARIDVEQPQAATTHRKKPTATATATKL